MDTTTAAYLTIFAPFWVPAVLAVAVMVPAALASIVADSIRDWRDRRGR